LAVKSMFLGYNPIFIAKKQTTHFLPLKTAYIKNIGNVSVYSSVGLFQIALKVSS